MIAQRGRLRRRRNRVTPGATAETMATTIATAMAKMPSSCVSSFGPRSPNATTAPAIEMSITVAHLRSSFQSPSVFSSLVGDPSSNTLAPRESWRFSVLGLSKRPVWTRTYFVGSGFH